jgi:C4-type Zn-finger protein
MSNPNTLRDSPTWPALRTREEIAHDKKQRCPLCGSGEIEIHYVDDGIEPMTGYVMAGYVFECFSCGERGEWE